MAVRAIRAEQEARAVNIFLQDDLLAQASASNQARPETKPDPHLEVRTALDRAAGRIAGKFESLPLVEASIRQTIGNTYMNLGLYSDAQSQVERAVELRRRMLGQRHPDTLVSQSRLALVYALEGKYAQAEELYNETLDVQRRVMGEEHSFTLTSMNGLANLYQSEGKYSQAETLLIKLLESQRRVLGEEHPDAMRGKESLGVRGASQKTVSIENV